MTSLTTEPPTLRLNPSISVFSPFSADAAPHRRSYSCYNCNHSFYITPTAATSSAASPSSFRCPRCHHRHLIPHHTISPPPPPPPNPDSAPDSSVYIHYTSDDSDSDSDSNSDEDEDEDENDYDSDNSLLSFATPNLHPPAPALKFLVASLPIKSFPPNSIPSLQSCSICMEDFEIKPDASVIVNELPCEHYFHKDCIVEWLQRSNSCPLCRYKFPCDPGPEQGTGQREVEYDAVLLVDFSPISEPVVRRRSVNVEEGLSSSGGTSGSERRNSRVNGAGISGVYIDAMRDEDGDVMMIDA